MRATSIRRRLVSALTLFSFTLTTISPSLAWAAEREESRVEATARVIDKVPSKDLEASRSNADVAESDAVVSKEKPPVDELKGAVGGTAEKTPNGDAPVHVGSDSVAALPTGGDKSGVTSQSISVPKGAGTISGMGESFSAQLSTGIATFSVPFAMPGARGGAQPSLGLSYSSASGSGLAGMGWSVGVPYIARQTDRGLPGYNEGADWNPNQDRFVFNGGQELVPICTVKDDLGCAGKLDQEDMPAWSKQHQYFRPRVEGSFLRFFWSPDHLTWRVQDKGGVTMELGVPLDGSNAGDHLNGLETNPDDHSQIFRWHLARQYDTYGQNMASATPQPFNVVVYKYLQNGGQAYLSDIYDTTPAATPTDTATLDGFAHHTHLVYDARTDPTESYRSGWLIKQTLRLTGVDVASKTQAGTGVRRMVRRYHLAYDGVFHVSYLTSVQVEGRCAGDEASAPAESGGQLGDTSCATLPAMTFDYSHTKGFNAGGNAVGAGLAGYEAFDARLQKVGGSPPHSIDEELADYFDVNADGLPDLLVTAPGVYGSDFGVFYNSDGGTRDTFGGARKLPVFGVLGANSGTLKLSNPNVTPLDLDADGIVDFLHMPLVKQYAVYSLSPKGLFGRVIETASKQSPKLDLGRDAAQTRVADVNFDGMVDVVVSTGTQFQTFFALGRLPEGDAQFGQGSWSTNATARLVNEPVRKCVPYAGKPVQFADAEIELADMNGDGIADIVSKQRGNFRYWPGRGNGFWGTGKLDDCPADTFSAGRYVSMQDSPYFSDIQGTSMRMDDVNGDGLDDLVQVRFDGVDVWLNVDGTGWTSRYIIDSTPASPSYADRVRLIDVNGSGTRDVVWGNGDRYQYMDLAGGERPGLLVSVKNGLGKLTAIEYASSTSEMLAAERTGTDCTGAEGTFDNKWCSKMPTVTHVVKRVTESDNLSVAGSGASQYATEYSYRDPVYDGRQREFRGFRRARSKRIGDDNSPTDVTESTFLLGECEDETADDVDDCALSERWRDNPKEALKGLPVVTERFDEQGRYLSTEATTYRLRQLYLGLDGRHVRHAFESRKRTTLYDTSADTTATGFDTSAPPAPPAADVQLELAPPTFIAASSYSSLNCSLAGGAGNLPAETYLPMHVTPVPLRASTGYAIMESTAYVDTFGNATISVAKGCVAGSACPAAQTGNDADEMICSFTVPDKVTGSSTGWLYRTVAGWVRGSVQTDIRKKTLTDYSVEGAPTKTSAVLYGTQAVKRFHDTAGRTVATTPASASQDGTRVLGTRTYDAFGNLEKETGPTGLAATPTDLGRCRTITYDVSTYRQEPMSETVFTGGCDHGGLTTIASYDRGLGLVTQVTDMNSKVTSVFYDSFGRLTILKRPSLLAPGQEQLASVIVDYSLPSPQDPRAYSIIHTQTQDGANQASNEYLENYSFIDGMGRARVGLAEADTSAGDDAAWIVSSIADFDAKGAVRRKFLPFFKDAAPPAFDLAAVPPSQYGDQIYDAFGRQLQTLDVDGTVTLQSRYHALSTDLADAADIYPGPHEGSYASTRTDGHGRAVEMTERVHDNDVLDVRYTRTKYLPTGEPTVISRVRAGSPSVVRWMRYDTLGRMVLNVDPHTTANFNVDPATNPEASPTSTSTGLKAWIYAYNDAGDLVATSDARGCGQNFHYDGAGRLYGEDYSPCLAAHTTYTAPSVGSTPYDVSTLSTAARDAFEVFYQFDASPTAPVARPATGDGFDTTADTANLLGRLAAVHDRAATTWFTYDALGRTSKTFRKVSYIGAPKATIAGRYVDHWYHQTFYYDAADRPIEQTTGATTTELQATTGLSGTNNTSAVRTAFTKRGTLKNVDSSYGELVHGIKRTADGLVTQLTFGDAAGTQTAMSYDTRRRLASVQTFRSLANLWSTAPPSITPAPGATDATRQLLLQDLDYSYDLVNNPTEIHDWRTPEEWPDTAKPVTRRMEYDDLYRLTRVDYEYPGGFDKSASPFANEIAGTYSDPRRPIPPGHRLLDKRPNWQTYKYDWLGNTTRTDDDQHAFWDRSLGDITNNDSSAVHPYRFIAAIQPSASSQHSGSLTSANTGYDASGNLTSLQLGRTTPDCSPGLAICSSRFFYTWDEVGRLVTATRTEGSGSNSTGPSLDYLYDANDERVVKQHFARIGNSNTFGPTTATLYVFDSLEIRRAPFNSVTKQYTVDSTTEVAYLAANGMRLARLVYEPTAKGEPKLVTPDAKHSSNLHIFLELPDHLGSESLTIDHASGELVEARTYQPYGATESDYRPDRWKGYREDYGFTGKEEDVEVGLQYFGKRYLSPYLGRWISADPLAVHAPGSADLNLYAYVSGEVLKDIDPVGLCQTGQQCVAGTDTQGNDPAGPAEGSSKLTPQQRQNAEAVGSYNGKIDAGLVEKAKELYSLYFDNGLLATGDFEKDSARFGKAVANLVKREEARKAAPPSDPDELAAYQQAYDHEVNETFREEISNESRQTAASMVFPRGASRGLGAEPEPAAGAPRQPIPERALPPPAPRATPRGPGATLDPTTGEPVGRFIVDPKGNTMIEPKGGRTVPAGKNGGDTHTTYPNGSNYQRLNPQGHPNNSTPHGHGHAPGTGTGKKGQGASLAPDGTPVPFNSPAAHWPIK